MSEHQEPLIYLPPERWYELHNIFKSDGPRSISGYAALEIQKQLASQGICCNLKVYCPFGDVNYGMVAINDKIRYEVIIKCPISKTDQLSDVIKRTKVIDWSKEVIVVGATHDIYECLQNTVQHIDVGLDIQIISYTFILEHEFDNVCLPSNITFGPVTLDDCHLVNTTWPHRYPNSVKHFEQLIKAKLGFGLFCNKDLISWVFLREIGQLQHLYTVEAYRRKGYAELVLKIASNMWLKEKKIIFAYCLKHNINACQLYRKLGFVEGESAIFCRLYKKI